MDTAAVAPSRAVTAPGAGRERRGVRSDAVRGLIVLVVYAVAVGVSRRTVLPDVGIALFWPAGGVAALCVLWARSARQLVVIVLALLAATMASVVFYRSTLSSTAVFAVAHTLQALLVWLVVTRLQGAGPWAGLRVRTVGDLLRLLAAAALASTGSSVIGSYAASLDSGSWSWMVPLTWAIRNTFGIVVIAVSVLHVARLLHAAWRERPAHGLAWLADRVTPVPRPHALLELSALLVFSAALEGALFLQRLSAPLAFLVVAVVAWAGQRFTPVVVAVHSLVFGTLSVLSTLYGYGPFITVDNPLARAATVQLFVGITTLVGFMLSLSTTAQAHLARQVVEEGERFNRTISRLDDFVWSVEVRGLGDHRMVYASPNGSRVFGGVPPPWEEQENVAAAMADRMHPDDQATTAEFFVQAAQGRHAEMEVRFRGYDGVYRWLWIRGTGRREGDRLYFDGISTNIEDRKALADYKDRLLVQQEERMRELRELDTMRDQFLAIAGHELRTPLTVLRGFAELLCETTEADSATSKQARTIHRRTLQLQDLVEDFFDLATFQAGRIDIDRVEVDLGGLLVAAVADHRGVAAQAGVTVQLQALPVVVVGDPVRLRQVVDNLLSNSFKYTPAGGTVWLSCVPLGGRAVLTVTDDGVGVPEEELPHLFDPFFRASNADRRTVQGTGLGLSVVKAIVDAHGGSVRTDRGPSGGLALAVTLPRVPGPTAEPADAPVVAATR